jgi:hypothetical protein
VELVDQAVKVQGVGLIGNQPALDCQHKALVVCRDGLLDYAFFELADVCEDGHGFEFVLEAQLVFLEFLVKVRVFEGAGLEGASVHVINGR